MNNWHVDLLENRVIHANGTEITFTGHPESSNFHGHPAKLPPDLSAVEQVSLIRTGFEAYRHAIAERFQAPKPTADEKPPNYSTVNSNRPKLSLKSRKQASKAESTPADIEN